MGTNERLAAFGAALRRFDSYVVTGHVNPDPDCLGTMLAIGWGLTRLGKRVTLVSPDPVPEGLTFMPGAKEIRTPPAPKADVLLVVDCEPARTGEIGEYLDRFDHVFNLDHHVSNTATGPNVYVDADAAAAGEIATELLIDGWGLTLSPEAATNLYTAIMTDTGSFRFDNTSADTLRTAARLVEAGARPGAVSEAIYESMTWTGFEVLRDGLATLTRSADGRIAWIVLTEEMVRAGGESESGLSQYPRMIAGVEIGLLLRPLPEGGTRVSLRSKGNVDVSEVAARFGGGGHVGAAGCTVDAPPNEALTQVVAAAEEALSGTARNVRKGQGESG